MESYEDGIADYFGALNPEVLELSEPLRVEGVSRLELGESNLNFLVKLNGRKYILRINMDPASERKSRTEFRILSFLATLGIAPRAFCVNESLKPFGETFLVIEHIEGTPLSTLLSDFAATEVAEKLARVVGKVHRLDVSKMPTDLPARGTTYEGWVEYIRKEVQYIRTKRQRHSLGNDRFERLLDDALARMELMAREATSPTILVPSHGDVCASNVIVEDGTRNLRLIDWESFGLRDPASELATIFEAFGLKFTPSHEKAFLKAYSTIRDDETIVERLKTFRPLVRFENLTWGIRHVFEIADGEMDKAFVEATRMSRHLDFVQVCLTRCAATGLIDTRLGEAVDLNIFPPEVYRS
jgi:aminoglycoside phosphotransferase (APT) family kinase protein